MRHYGRHLAIFEDLARTDRGDLKALAGVRDARMCLLHCAQIRKRWIERDVHLSAALDLADQLALALPYNREAQLRLSVVLGFTSMVEYDLGEFDSAMELLQQAHHIVRRLAEADPDRRSSQRLLIDSYRALSEVTLSRKTWNEGLGYIEAALALVEGLVDESSRLTEDVGLLAHCVNIRAILNAQLGRLDRARPDTERARALYHELATRPSAPLTSVINYALHLLETPHEELRDPVEALCWAERAYDLAGPDPSVVAALGRALAAVGR